MPFAKVSAQVDFPALERDCLKFWDESCAFDRLRAKNRGGPRWSFLDGPITANNPMGVHHAWGRTYKDAYQRYFAMTGHELRYQNGFDCQGLWVEVEVEKSLNLRSKRDIENLVEGDRFASIDRFASLCKQRVDKYARVQTEQSVRLGYWMDWDMTDEDWARQPGERRSYFTMSEENNYTIWAFLKKCHQRGLVYRGYDAMPWCGRCGTGISQMEMSEGYRLIEHRAVFVKFPLRDRPGENLLAWTTTPWTLSSNVAAAVNPELTYLRVKSRGEVYYLAKGAFKVNRMESAGDEEDAGKKKSKREWLQGVPHLRTIEQMFKEKSKEGYEVLGEVKGAEMVGWAYDGPFDEFPAQQAACGHPAELAEVVRRQRWAAEVSSAAAHRVIPWKDVGEAEGTGIVHIAPGCGKEDFELGKGLGLPTIAPLTDHGTFLDGFGDLTGRSAVAPDTVEAIFAALEAKGRLFQVERYAHKYPHCWRCKTELLFRLVDEWYIAMSWRDEIKRVVEQATFLPEAINGKARELDWLTNMGDWMISKKRFWGLALPIWVDEQDPNDFDVIGSREELRERAVEGWGEFDGHTPHRPWIDKVKVRNPRTGNLMSRIPDVGNPWLDAGIVPYSTLGYNRDRAEWEKWFPADLITESFPGQFRNWFYAILAMSTMMEGRTPFKVLLGHAQVRDEHGEEMHKSKGNSIPFDEAAEVMGADVCRWLYCRHNPAANVNFGYGVADEIRARFHLKLWNTYAFFCNYAVADGFDPAAPEVPVAERPDIDRWILSDLGLLVSAANEAFRTFHVMGFCLEAERFVDDKLSNWFVRRNRRRFWKSEHGPDKSAAYQTLYSVLKALCKLIAPVNPFLAEVMWRNLRLEAEPDSVHLCDYPRAEEFPRDEGLSADTEALLRLVTLGGAARSAAKIKVRQPLAELKIRPGTEADRRAVGRFGEQLRDELNVKAVTLTEEPLLTPGVKLNLKAAGPKLGPRLKEVQAALAAADPGELTARLSADGKVSLADADLTAEDLLVTHAAPDGWHGVVDRGTQVSLDGRVTEELAQEGMARDVIRYVQDLRKQAGLDMQDRIRLGAVTASPRLAAAIERHRGAIAAETLAVGWLDGPAGGEGQGTDVRVDGQELSLRLEKATDVSEKPWAG